MLPPPSAARSTDPPLAFADLTLDPAGCRVCRRGRRVDLTATELELPRHFMLTPKRVLSRHHLCFGGRAMLAELISPCGTCPARTLRVETAPMLHVGTVPTPNGPFAADPDPGWVASVTLVRPAAAIVALARSYLVGYPSSRRSALCA